MRRARIVASRLARRPLLAAALLYAVASLAMVGPGLLPGRTLSSSDYLWSTAPWQAQRPHGVRPHGGSNAELADSVSAFAPLTRRVRATLPAIALWNPDIAAGRPLLADMQSGVFSPFSVPSYVLPYWWSLGIVAALRLFVAALGTFVLARALSIGVAGALLSGLAFGLSLWMVAWVSWPLASVWALLPWLLVAVARVVRRPDAAGVAWLGLASGLSVLAGHPESTFHATLAAAVFAILCLSRTNGRRARRAGLVVLGLAAGAALAAIVVVPFLELVGQSSDFSNRSGSTPVHLRAENLLALFFPEYWGRPTQFTTQAFINTRALYDGALPLLLAGVALLRPTRERIGIAIGAVLALMVIFGVWPAYQTAVNLPGLGQSYISRLAVFACLGIALLAGWGLQDVLDSGRRSVRDRRDRLLAAGLLAAVMLPVAFVVVRGRADLSTPGRAVEVALGVRDNVGVTDVGALLPTASAIAWLLFAGLGVALILLTSRRRVRPPIAATLAITLVAIDLLRFGLGENPSIPLAHAQQPATPAVRLLQARTPARFVGVLPESGLPPLPADAAMTYGLQDARSYDYPVVSRYDRLWRRAIAPAIQFIPPTTLASTTPLALRMLSLLGVRSLLQQPADHPLTEPSLRLIYDRRDARIYDNTHALPRAWIVDRQITISGGDGAQLRAIEAPDFQPAAAVVVGHPLNGIPAAATAPARSSALSAQPARIVRYGAQDVKISARTQRPAVVVLSDVWYPGWHATVDGHDTPIHRVDYLLRGVSIGPGTHRVELTYRPASYRIGWIISVLTALTLAAAALYTRRITRPLAT